LKARKGEEGIHAVEFDYEFLMSWQCLYEWECTESNEPTEIYWLWS